MVLSVGQYRGQILKLVLGKEKVRQLHTWIKVKKSVWICTCSVRVLSWLRSFMRHGVGEWEGEGGVSLSPIRPSVLDHWEYEELSSPETPSNWWKFHKPTFLMQNVQLRMGRFAACRPGLHRDIRRDNDKLFFSNPIFIGDHRWDMYLIHGQVT